MLKIKTKKQLYGSNGQMNLDIDIEIADGDFVALAGESGSGKTTLLRILAGLESADGFVEVGGVVWLDNSISLAPQRREIGFVFQDYALFDNMSVEDNLLFVSKDMDLAYRLLEVTGLWTLRDRMPHTLSGGQKQRVSLCRALMNRPKLLLMDEPLSAIDPVMRMKLQNEILALHKEFGTTTIMVSHDPSEIYRLSNRVLVLEQGQIVSDGSAKDVLLRTTGSAKFSFEGEVLDIVMVDVIFVAIVAIGQQIVEVVLSEYEANNLEVGSMVEVSTKAFAPSIVAI